MVASKSVLSLGTILLILAPLATTLLITIEPLPVLSIPVGLPALSSSPSPSLYNLSIFTHCVFASNIVPDTDAPVPPPPVIVMLVL